MIVIKRRRSTAKVITARPTTTEQAPMNRPSADLSGAFQEGF